MLQKRSVALPTQVTLEQVVDAARDAVRAFVELRTSRVALSTWLHGPYQDATRFGPRRMVTSLVPESGAQQIDVIIANAQQEVRSFVTTARRSQSTDALLRKLPRVVHIVPAHDATGAHGFIPIDAQGGPLVDRVIALALADYLTRPADFVAHSIVRDASPKSGERRSTPDAPTLPQMPAVRGK